MAKKVLPAPLSRRLVAAKSAWKLRREFDADRKRYASAMLPDDGHVSVALSGRNLEAQITKDYHRIEKGLALAAPRRPFGVTSGVLSRLEMLMPHADEQLAYSGYASSAREALVEWNGGNSSIGDVSPVRAPHGALNDPEGFFGSRHSVRDFAERDVQQDVLDRAVGLAINSPSVCNRQAWHVRFYRQPRAASVLAHQNGNAGFRESVPVVAVVTVDAQMFAGTGERNQGWIEGGLFSMSLVWALHALGLDTCMLNMSVDTTVADGLRSEVGIPQHELVIMMIAIGHGREGHRRARSARRDIHEVIR